jgi:hypothetical protein
MIVVRHQYGVVVSEVFMIGLVGALITRLDLSELAGLVWNLKGLQMPEMGYRFPTRIDRQASPEANNWLRRLGALGKRRFPRSFMNPLRPVKSSENKKGIAAGRRMPPLRMTVLVTSTGVQS